MEAIGVDYRRVIVSRSSLHGAQYEDAIWQYMDQKRPRHVWANVGIRGPNEGELERVGQLCHELHSEQTARGGHFHVRFHGEHGMWKPFLPEVFMSTYETRYDPKSLGISRRYRGNNFLQGRAVPQTTSKKCIPSWTTDIRPYLGPTFS